MRKFSDENRSRRTRRSCPDDYEREQGELRAKSQALEAEIQNWQEQTENVDRFLQTVKKYLNLQELTPTVLNDLVYAVYVHAPDKSGGHRVQQVTICYNYIGILPAELLGSLAKEETA